jgi:hypothetical protein
MSRTRLDEIVEEETRAFPEMRTINYFGPNPLGKIAERAFRHGVEQANAINNPSLTYKGLPWIWDVPPAPAEDDPTCWCSSSSPHPAHLDRRTGKDRRK